MILEGGSPVADASIADWRNTMVFTLRDAVERHPLARRVLGGLEPDVIDRVLDIPALTELRKATIERLRSEQLTGTVRSDIDATEIGNGVIAIVLSLLMSVVQLGPAVAGQYANDVAAVFVAAIETPPDAAPRT